jgi:hypothetical protein
MQKTLLPRPDANAGDVIEPWVEAAAIANPDAFLRKSLRELTMSFLNLSPVTVSY